MKTITLQLATDTILKMDIRLPNISAQYCVWSEKKLVRKLFVQIDRFPSCVIWYLNHDLDLDLNPYLIYHFMF